MKVFVIGSSFTGKTTLIEKLTRGRGVGTLRVKDERFERLVKVFRPRKSTPLSITLIDSDAVGKAYNERKPTRIFQELVEADAFVEVVGGLVGDFMGFTDTTLKFLGIESEVLERRIDRLRKEVAVGKGSERELEVLERSLELVSDGIPLYAGRFKEKEIKILRGLGLLSVKPRLILFNVPQDASLDEEVLSEAKSQGLPYVIVDVLNDDPEILNKKISSALLEMTGTITFFTPGKKETRAWPLKRGSTVLEAAATVHNDLARKFVKAEVIGWERLVEAGGWKEAKEKNWVRLEGKDYIVQDGDCIFIRAS
ncbi:MAG: DUF933 domain-containing protein [Thermotogae bacterium]|nr:DUF933 domain-containing protein [Thermotogota bacterium]